MSFKTRQKSINELDEPKLSSRTRFNETSQTRPRKQEKSVKKSTSIKYLKQISPKRQKSSSKNIGNKILKLLENYEHSINDSSQQNFVMNEANNPKLLRALQTIDFDKKRNIQTSKDKHQKQIHDQKICIKQKMLQKLQSNEAKIVLMRQGLENVFDTYKQREKQIAEMKSSLKNTQKIKNENQFLSKQIARVQEMIKQALLERQKLKYGPFSQLTRRSHK